MVVSTRSDAESQKYFMDRTPAGRKGRPEEITGAAIFLAADCSSMVTGHTLVVDGRILVGIAEVSLFFSRRKTEGFRIVPKEAKNPMVNSIEQSKITPFRGVDYSVLLPRERSECVRSF